MPIIPAGDIKITFKCPDCGPTKLVLSDGHADDSIASCGGCGREFGKWADVKARAHREAVDVGRQAIRKAFRR
jgi:transcription elongation factor Elf1